MDNLYKFIELDDSHYIEIYYDEYSDDPTKWGSDVLFCIREHRRYNFPNQLEYDWDSAEEDSKKLYEDYWIFNLDCYEHSGITFSLSGTGPQCRWDTSSDCGFLAVPKKDVPLEVFAKDKAISMLKTYNQYLNGEVYCFKLMQTFPSITDDLNRQYYTDDEEIECECTHGYFDLEEIAENIPQEFKEVFLKAI